MKTLYLIKSFSPFLFVLTAPSVMQTELERHGLLSYKLGSCLTILAQVAVALGVFLWIKYLINQPKGPSKALLKMSCVSKKVFHQGNWISVEQYLADHHNIVVSHGLTPEESKDWMRQALEDAARNPEMNTKRKYRASERKALGVASLAELQSHSGK